MAGTIPPNGGEYVTWRMYDRDRSRDDRERAERRRALDADLNEIKHELKEVRAIAEQVRDVQRREADEGAGKASVGRAIWVYIVGGALILVSILSGVLSIIVNARGGR